MRVVQNNQMTIGEVDVSQIKFDPKSRDDIPKILRGLQHLYLDASLRSAIFALLESQIAPKINKSNGRPGMTLWNILVCGVIRLDLNMDYDRLHEMVSKHSDIRAMLGLAIYAIGYVVPERKPHFTHSGTPVCCCEDFRKRGVFSRFRCIHGTKSPFFGNLRHRCLRFP